MLGDAYSLNKLRIIYDYENRKGECLDTFFFPDILNETNKIKTYKKFIKNLNKKKKIYNIELYNKIKKCLYDKIYDFINKKEDLIKNNLMEIISHITNNKYMLKINKVILPDGKTGYTIDQNDKYGFFAIKIIQYSLYHIYKIKQSNRNIIIPQIFNTLNNNMPKFVLRLDIKSFYESISQERIIDKISEDHLLSTISIDLIK